VGTILTGPGEGGGAAQTQRHSRGASMGQTPSGVLVVTARIASEEEDEPQSHREHREKTKTEQKEKASPSPVFSLLPLLLCAL
jgi:hypothetical protein